MSNIEPTNESNSEPAEEQPSLWDRMHTPETLAWVALVRANEVEAFDDDDPIAPK